jgi:hypothetical protein
MKNEKMNQAIDNEIRQWIEETECQLPLNVNTLKIKVWEVEKDNHRPKINLDKYAAEPSFVNPLYKPYSKMFDFSDK